MLTFAKGLSLPTDAVTQKFAFLGRTGSGKSYAAKRFVESLLALRAQTVIIDCVGVWSGLRLGKRSFEIPVLGGIHGDIDLPDTAGALVADLICDKRLSAVLDVSQFLDAQRTRFVEAFGRQLFQRKKMAPSAMHLVLEEAQEIVPQNPQPGEQMMLHEYQRIAKLGRNFGIGLSLISQRPQEVNKKALNQSECVLAFQMTGPQERKALEYWLSDRGIESEQSLAKLLPSLAVGKPFIWSPQWLKVAKVFEILPIESLDTSKTPSIDGIASTFELSPIVLTELEQAFTTLAVEAKDNDPKALKARIKALEAQVAQGVATEVFGLPPDERVNARALIDRARAAGTGLTRLIDAALHNISTVEERLVGLTSIMHQAKELGGSTDLTQSLTGFFERIEKIGNTAKRAQVTAGARMEKVLSSTQKPRKSRAEKERGNGTALPRCDALILQVLAQHGAMGLFRVAMLAGYPPRASTARNALGRLRTMGYIEGENALVTITALGRKNCPEFEQLPETPAERAGWWYPQLPAVDAAMLKSLVKHYPKRFTLDQISVVAGYEPGKSTTRNAAGRLRSLGLIEGNNNAMIANWDLCE